MPSANVCQVLMYINAILCQGVLGHARDYKACQHMLGECYDMLGHANMCLGVLLMARCSRYKGVPCTKMFQDMRVPMNASVCQSMLRCAMNVEEC